MCEIYIYEIEELSPEAKKEMAKQKKAEALRKLKLKELSKMQAIETAVCNEFNIDKNDISIDSKEHKICDPRNIIFCISLEKTQLKEYEIGNFYGFKRGRVHHSKKVVSDLIYTDKEFRDKVTTIKKALVFNNIEPNANFDNETPF
jgi:chromosomal replication initiation ATPase DnaA